ncbi:retrovirus-related pol polyprotein from transposon TNT 1-94 [Tanacetum coccineum]
MLSRSSAEAEYRGVANAVDETCWLRNLLRELDTPLSSATLVYCDNISVVFLSCNLVQHQRTKHIEIDIYFVRDLVAASQVRVLHVPSRYQFADIFTKGLPSTLFEEFRSKMAANSSTLNVSQPHIPVFKGESYEFWSIKMKTLFKSQDLWDFVESGYAEESDDEARSAKVITVKLQSLRRDFETSYMKNNESAQEYLAKISSIVSQMRSYGNSISDEVIVAKVLRSLALKFDHVVAAIEESKDLSMFSFDELMGSLQAHEVRINRSFEKEEEKVFQTKGESYSSSERGRGRSRGGFRGCGRGRGQSSPYTCTFYNKNGHTEKFCWSKPEEAKYA